MAVTCVQPVAAKATRMMSFFSKTVSKELKPQKLQDEAGFMRRAHTHRHRVSRTEQRRPWCEPKHSFEMRITVELSTAQGTK